MLSREAWYAAAIGAILGGILSIPLQLGTGLLFPRVQLWFDARSKARAFARSKRTRKEYEEALYFVTYPHKMTHYFLNRGFELLRLSVVLFLAAGSLFWGRFTLEPGIWNRVGWLAAIGGSGFLYFVIFQSVDALHSIYYRVEFWGEYKKKVALELPDIVDDTHLTTT